MFGFFYNRRSKTKPVFNTLLLNLLVSPVRFLIVQVEEALLTFTASPT